MNKPQTPKYLPCKTFVMCGSCPYYERCRYIHDIRIENNNYKTLKLKNEKKNLYRNIYSWFWPYDYSSLYNNYKYYNINNIDNFEEFTLYSIWYNFIDYLNHNHNHNNNRKRLPIFIHLESKKLKN